MISNFEISVIGLGYVGLPVALNLSKNYKLVGYDINRLRILKLKKNIDINNEFTERELSKYQKIKYTSNEKDISDSQVYIVTLPTPIDKNKRPNLSYLKNACILISKYLKKNNIIVFESTVYPGLTEEYCAPLIEKYSSMIFNRDFFIGYSPERINPGDKKNNIKSITKVVSASNRKTLKKVIEIYSSICENIHVAESIKVAEGAKIIENVQRDINIALINELSIVFDKLDINFNDVLKAAGTKWNFLPFQTGLVGGHCIGVDPYYLSYRMKKINYNTELILAGRKINDNYTNHIIDKISKNYSYLKKNAKILILGFAFKENVSDIRNTKVDNLFKSCKKIFGKVDIFDPVVDPLEVKKEYKIMILENPKIKYDICIYVVPHKIIQKSLGALFAKTLHKKSIVYDLKYKVPKKLGYKIIN